MVSFKHNKKEPLKEIAYKRQSEQHQKKRYSEATDTFLHLPNSTISGSNPKAHEQLNPGKRLGSMGWATTNHHDLGL